MNLSSHIWSDGTFVLSNLSLLACSFLAVYLIVKGRVMVGAVLLFSFLSDHAYRLALIYGDVHFSPSGMEGSLLVHSLEVMAMAGKLLLPVGIWMLIKPPSVVQGEGHEG